MDRTAKFISRPGGEQKRHGELERDALADTLRYTVWDFQSVVLPDDRTVMVYLPAAYLSEPHRRFPVLYLNDGQNLFDNKTSYVPGRTWRAHITADALTQNGEMEPIILVGVANTGLRRMAEYTPTRDYKMGGGEGDKYGRMLVEELKPFVDSTYRTETLPEHTGLGGSSLGGLISLYLGLALPQSFGRVAVMSPAIWWDHRSILSVVAHLEAKPNLRIWLDMGTAEGARHLRDADALYRLLIRMGWKIDLDLKYHVVDGGVHDEEAWASRFNSVLRFLFPPVRP